MKTIPLNHTAENVHGDRLCPVVAKACQSQKGHYISVAKSNRWFTVGSTKRRSFFAL